MYKPKDEDCRDHIYADWGTNDIVQQLTYKNAASTISHCCHEPDRRRIYSVFKGTTLEACLLMTAYSLIVQLLEVRPNLDKFKVSLKKLRSLGMQSTHWETALNILDDLLFETISVRSCIIQWLPALEDNEVKYKSKQFLDLFFYYKEIRGLRLVLVTIGESLYLSEKVKEGLH